MGGARREKGRGGRGGEGRRGEGRRGKGREGRGGDGGEAGENKMMNCLVAICFTTVHTSC